MITIAVGLVGQRGPAARRASPRRQPCRRRGTPRAPARLPERAIAREVEPARRLDAHSAPRQATRPASASAPSGGALSTTSNSNPSSPRTREQALEAAACRSAVRSCVHTATVSFDRRPAAAGGAGELGGERGDEQVAARLLRRSIAAARRRRASVPGRRRFMKNPTAGRHAATGLRRRSGPRASTTPRLGGSVRGRGSRSAWSSSGHRRGTCPG